MLKKAKVKLHTYIGQDLLVDEHDIPKIHYLQNSIFETLCLHPAAPLLRDPTHFKPERFEKESESSKLLSFGLGRRACAGGSLAQRTMGLTPALLIQYFEWKKISEEEIDMTRRRNYCVKKNSFRSYVPNVSITGHQECFLTASAIKIARTHVVQPFGSRIFNISPAEIARRAKFTILVLPCFPYLNIVGFPVKISSTIPRPYTSLFALNKLVHKYPGSKDPKVPSRTISS
ncbi:hypothetical protein JHK85_003546 [Glycine max]|uniref:Cytochrome P450 81E8 n=1 Tax=Glycine soja TaxID=3848 RepID=A0A445LKM9_GLYSO|nr:hypothetical protein JHK87_003231 [Glycine soja]KAG5062363.1 hypothetical protein JHK85_003546 [Glycine max]RZC23735.1 Cytochrome P450 81E8 [Glycine soja]